MQQADDIGQALLQQHPISYVQTAGYGLSGQNLRTQVDITLRLVCVWHCRLDILADLTENDLELQLG